MVGSYASRILEPAAGRGSIIAACKRSGFDGEWWAVEVDEARRRDLLSSGLVPAERVCGGDFLTLDLSSLPLFDFVVTNPPYSLAEEFVKRSLSCAGTVCMLLRLGFLASRRRADFMRAHPPDVYVLSRRPSFSGRGTDATEYGWFVWYRWRSGGAGKVMVLTDSDS